MFWCTLEGFFYIFQERKDQMFNFGKKKNKNLYSPVDGTFLPIEEVKDKVFSSKVMGDGFAVYPSSDIISAPCDGILTMIFPTNHAFAITSNDNKEVLIHIGIDTVNLKGEGFEVLKKIGEKVSTGDEIIKVNRGFVSQNYDLSTMVVITNGIHGHFENLKLNQLVNKKDLIMTFEWGA